MASNNLKEELASLRIDHSARGGGSRRGVWIFLVLVLVAAAAGGWVWANRDPVAEVKTAAVSAASGAAGAVGAVLNASGYVTARRRATVSSKVTGKVLEIFVEEGQAVKQGQVLARLDDAQVRAMLKVARAQLTAAQHAAAEDQARLREAHLTLDRRNQLVKEKVISRAELDAAQAEVESLTARIALAQEQVEVAQSQVEARLTDLTDMVVRAPFDGVAISKDAQPGEMISPVSAGGGFTRTGICTIVDMSSLEIEVDVSEQYINRVEPGQPVEAVLDAYPDWRIPAKVITTVPSADRQKSTVRVRIAFEPSPSSDQRPESRSLPRAESRGLPRAESRGSPPPRSKGLPRAQSRKDALDPRILPDMGVKTSFLAEAPVASKDPPKPRLLVPKPAVRAADNTTVVFVVKGDRVERRAVKTGLEEAGQVEIVSGLTSGERIVVEGPPTLIDGAKVKER